MDGLVDYYRRVAGEHENWDDYRSAMQRERRVLLRVTWTAPAPTAPAERELAIPDGLPAELPGVWSAQKAPLGQDQASDQALWKSFVAVRIASQRISWA